MPYSYNRLWKILIDRSMTKEQLRTAAQMSPTTIAAMGRGEGISPKVLERICKTLCCQPGDIMEYVPYEQDADGTLKVKTPPDILNLNTVDDK